MPYLWVDADVLIQAKNRWYGFDFAPGFWQFLDQLVANGVLRSSSEIYRELTADSEDELSDWAKARQNSPLWVEPDEAVQAMAAEVINWVNDNFDPVRSAKFLNGADPWLIAHARIDNGIIVSHESPAGPNAKTPKIPNVAKQFDLEVWDVVRMLRTHGAIL